MRCRPAIVIIENNHVLLMKYLYGDQAIYNFPGGNAEGEELFIESLIRECREELGVEVEVEKMLCLGQMASNEFRKKALHILFVGHIVSGIPTLQAHETTANDLVWWPIAQLDQIRLYPNVGEIVQDYLITGKSGIYLGEINQEWIG
ncbi:MAG: hypothetical protein RJA76_418 [Bacteroidota bacterium]